MKLIELVELCWDFNQSKALCERTIFKAQRLPYQHCEAVRWRRSSHMARAPQSPEAGLTLSVPHSLVYNPVVAHIGQRLPGRRTLNAALRLRDVGSTSSRRRDVGGFWQRQHPLHSTSMELRLRPHFTCIPALLVQRKLPGFVQLT